MRLKIDGCLLIVTPEKGDPRYKKSNWTPDPLSTLLYHIKLRLNSMGFDLVKRHMGKDGHLVDDMQQYLTVRKPTSKGPHIYIYDPSWNVRCAAEDFNKG